MDLDKVIQKRTSCHKFSKKKPDWRVIIEAINAARFAPMAGDNFSLKFILVDDEEKIEKVAKTCQQDFIKDATYLVVVYTNSERTINAFGERGKKYCSQQCGAAIQNFLLKCEELGLATCWVGHFTDRIIKKEFKIPEEYEVEAVFPIGIESVKTATKKSKIDLDAYLYFNEHDNKKMRSSKKVNA